MENLICEQTSSKTEKMRENLFTNRRKSRRSTVVSVPSRDKSVEHSTNLSLSEHSIRVINENNSFPIDQPNVPMQTIPNRTTIRLSLPIRSNNVVNDLSTMNISSNEFTLPTNPPIRVSIEPQTNQPTNSIHDDDICPNPTTHSNNSTTTSNQDKINVDPSFKGTSTIVNYFMDLLKPSDNKLAMKLYGSRKGLLKERMRQQRAGHCIIHPCSNFRFYWDLIMLSLLITNVIVLPVAIAFFSEEINSARWIIFNVISDAFFLFDIVVNFRTGVLRNDFVDEIILEPHLIARNYLKSWFIVDLLSSLPIDYLFLFFDSGDHSGGYTIARTGRAIKVLRLVKLLSLLRLLRLSRLVRYIHQWEEVRLFSLDYFRLISFLVSINSKYGHENFKFISINNSVGSLEWLFTIYDSNVSKFSNRLLGFIEWFTECSLG